MKPIARTALAGGIAGVAWLALWFRPENRRDGQEVRLQSTGAVDRASGESLRAGSDERPRDEHPGFGSSGASSVLLRDEVIAGRNFLERAKNKSLALLVLYAHRPDPALLEQLRNRVGFEPEASLVLAMVNLREGGSLDERLNLLRRGAEAFPTDGSLLLCLSGAEAEKGNATSFLETLQKAAEIETADIGSGERRELMRSFLAELGTDPAMVWFVAHGKESLANELFCRAGASMAQALGKPEIKNLPLDQRIRVATDAITIAQRFNPHGDSMEMEALASQSLATKALKMLPPDHRLEDGRTAAEWIAAMNHRLSEEQKQLDLVRPFLAGSPPSVRSEYLQRQEVEGSPAAIQWVHSLIHQKGAGQR